MGQIDTANLSDNIKAQNPDAKFAYLCDDFGILFVWSGGEYVEIYPTGFAEYPTDVINVGGDDRVRSQYTDSDLIAECVEWTKNI